MSGKRTKILRKQFMKNTKLGKERLARFFDRNAWRKFKKNYKPA